MRNFFKRISLSVSAILGLGALVVLLLVLGGNTIGFYALAQNSKHDNISEVIPDTPLYVHVDVSFNDGIARELNKEGGVYVTNKHVRKYKSGQNSIHFSVRNKSQVVANVLFFIKSDVQPVIPSSQHVLRASVMAKTTDKRSLVGLGYHLLGQQGQYVTEYMPSDALISHGDLGEQRLVAAYVDDGTLTYRGKSVHQLVPRFAVINLEPDAEVVLDAVWDETVVDGPVYEAGTIFGTGLRYHQADSNNKLYLGIQGVGLPDLISDAQSWLKLVDSNGRVVTQIASDGAVWRQNGRVVQSWSLLLPSELNPGLYDLVFDIKDSSGLSLPLIPLRDASKHRLGGIKVGSYQAPSAILDTLIGMSFHRYPGISEKTLGPIAVDYQFARSLSADGMSGMQWWLGEDKYDWNAVDAWAAFHGKRGRKLLLVFSGSPTWASIRPDEPSVMAIPGLAAPPAERYREAYAMMVSKTVARLQDRLLAVECWNEPDLYGSFTGTAQDLADLCKIVSTRTKSVNSKIQVICPQPESPNGLSMVLRARTSQGEPIFKYCDFVGSHIYGAMAEDSLGRPYDEKLIQDYLSKIRTVMAEHGVDKPIAVTEYGISSCSAVPAKGQSLAFGFMSSEDAGAAIYHAIRSFRQAGVKLLGLYSYDHLNHDPKCLPGGSYLRTMKALSDGRQMPDHVVLQKISAAIQEFGAPALSVK